VSPLRTSEPSLSSPVPTNRGLGGGCVALNLEEEVPPAGEQHMEEPILEEPGVAQPRGNDAPPPPPILSEVMDR